MKAFDSCTHPRRSRELKKLRRLLQRKSHIKMELCVRLSVLRLFQVGKYKMGKVHFRSLGTNGFHAKAKNEDLLLQARVVVRTSKMKILSHSLCRLRTKFHQKVCRTCSTIIFLHSINQIIDLWRCRCRRRFIRELKQPRRRRQQERHKFAYLTMKKQYFCTICTCIFHFLTFRRRSRSFHDVK